MAKRGKDDGDFQYLMQKDTLEGLELRPTYLKISQILLLRYDEFVDIITKFNQTINSLTDDEPDYIEFSIVPESDSTMLWKLFVRINCSRVCNIFFFGFTKNLFCSLRFHELMNMYPIQ